MNITILRHLLLLAEGCRLGYSAIDMLSDDVLLCVFDAYRQKLPILGNFEFLMVGVEHIWPWYDLVHVCRRWRHIVFAFPSYLDLRLKCHSKTDVEAAIDIWPALPLSISATFNSENTDEDDIFGALEHRDRIAAIHFWGFNHSQLKKCVALMEKPFPALKTLDLGADEKTRFVHTGSVALLGGSAPLLQWIHLYGTQFPSLPKLLSSTSDLVRLDLEDIPMTDEGHISPNAMATCLSVLTKLQSLSIAAQTLSPYPTDQRLPPSTYTVLPALVKLSLKGPHGYLEDLVGRVEAPLLKSGHLHFYDEPIFDTPPRHGVPQFIHRTKMFPSLGKVQVHFSRECIFASFRSSIGPAQFYLSFRCSGLPAGVAIMQRICAQWPPLFSHVEWLKLQVDFFPEEKRCREAITPWLGFLRAFTAVQTLHLRGEATVSHVARILDELEGERAPEVLPALRAIELHCSESGKSESLRSLEPFIVAREESEHPVTVEIPVLNTQRL